MTRMALWTSMQTALNMGPDYIKSLGYTDILVNRGTLPTLGGAMPEAWEKDWCTSMHAKGFKVFNLRYTQRRTQAPAAMNIQPHNYFDDAFWSSWLPTVETFARKVKETGYDGITWDTEDSWGWKWQVTNVTNLGKSQAEWNYMAAIRGRQFQDAIQRGFPGCTQIIYPMTFPRGHRHWVMHKEYGIEWGKDSAWEDLQTYWWLGVLGSPGRGRFHFANPLFYKVGHHNPPPPYSTTANSGEVAYWRNRYSLDRDGNRAYLTEKLGAGASTVHVPPMIAVSPIETGFGPHLEAKPTMHVKQQVMEAARAAELDGGLFVDYHHGGHPWVYPVSWPGRTDIHPTLKGTTFSYDPYKADMVAAGNFTLAAPKNVPVVITVKDAAGNSATSTVNINLA